MLLVEASFAATFNSNGFIIKDPVMNSGGFSSSNTFRLFGSVGQPFTGVSDSAGFNVKAGFLYFSDAITVTPTPTPTPTPSPQPGGGGPILDIFNFLIGLITPCKRSDLNCDGAVDIYDVGILFYWWDKPLAQPNFASAIASILGSGKPSPDGNSDKAVDIFDLSILLSDYTG